MRHLTPEGRVLTAGPPGPPPMTDRRSHHTSRRVRRHAPARAPRALDLPVRLFAAAAVALLALAALAGCGTASGAASDAAAEPRSLSVFAAASLTEAFTQLGDLYAAAHPGVTVTLNFAGSNDLVTQMQQGAPADVFAAADTGTMDKAGDLVDAPEPFAANRLVIAVAPGNPEGITGLGDLAREDLKVVLAAPEVPAGRYAGEVLAAAGLTVEPVSLEASVKGVVTKISLGEADAGIVYVTDVAAAGDALDGVAIPDDQNVVASYPIATVSASGHADDARAFVDLVLSADGQEVLAGAGFLPAR